MSDSLPINPTGIAAPTPQNTPLQNAPIAQGLSRPTVPDITEGDEPDEDEEDAEDTASGFQATMAGLVQGKLQSLLGKSSGYVESLPVEVKKSVAGLKGIQVKHTELQNQYKKECLELEKKYLELQKPLYERRHAIVTGQAQPTPEEIEEGEKVAQEDDPAYTPLPADAVAATPAAAIPEFWLTALRNHVGLSEIITDRDAGALKHLTDIRIAYLSPPEEDKPGFRLEFEFEENEYFENKVLTKTYYYQPEVGYSGDFLYERAVGTEIKWKGDDKDLTKEYEIKKQRNKNTNRTRLVRKSRPSDSFFNFFSPPVPPSDDEEEEVDAEDLDELEMKLEVDYQIGEDIKEKIIPRAIDYFTGKALEYESMDEDDDDYEDIDDDEDGFEDEDSDEDEAPARRRGPPKGRGANNVDPEECKQQ
ncbi:NAP-domain-containing protein [Punctularia strigosozonata HHB-11173 SS5]|uniref:NAP-domain-containing protein n=1 Tax=Punctularia strigosozonata (strain HHB-11173) TaxID=741275 RepID=R7RZC9_PUNST|nr:NAP-domain-containing protein [Punctularia strigosozonata HHB-11173 SS5]EIN03475.1 NAP-domain-containing protein [Punctularia strigosozonata HHB-11173 SS5]